MVAIDRDVSSDNFMTFASSSSTAVSGSGVRLTIYDRVFGILTPKDRAPSVVYGLADVDPTLVGSFGALLSVPFEPEGFLTQKSGSDSAHTDTIPV